MPRSTRAKLRLVASVGLALAALGVCSAWFINKYFGIEARAIAVRLWPPPTIDEVEHQQLRKIAGWFSLDCGQAHSRGEADRALACSQEALKTGRRFYVAVDHVGIDSYLASGVAVNSQGVMYEVTTDELPGGGLRTVDIARCTGTTIKHTPYGYLECAAFATK